MTDIMVDTETTAVDPEIGGIIQLSAIKFNLETLTVGDHFDRCPALLPKRNWEYSTREFWMKKNRAVFDSIIARQETGEPVFRDFVDWVAKDAPDGGYRFWAKPVKFDWPFVESHLSQLGLIMPFPHWQGFDVHSYIAGLRGEVGRTNIESEVEFRGSQHNALHDCAHQIDLLFHAKRSHVHAELVV